MGAGPPRDLALAAGCHDQRRRVPVARAGVSLLALSPSPPLVVTALEERNLFAEAEGIAARGAMAVVTGEPPSVPKRLPMMTV
jgi:hypothetical protein